MKKGKNIIIILTILPLAVFLLYGYLNPSSFFSNQEQIRNYVTSFGVWAAVIFILIQIIQVVITPFNHYAVGIAGGFIFGTWYGFLYNYIGRIIGHSIAFYLSHTFGRPLVAKFIKDETLAKYDQFWNKGGTLTLFLIYYLPFFPDDEISYLAGLSKMKYLQFMVANLLGQTGGSLALAYAGSGFKLETPISAAIFLSTGVTAVLFTIIWWKRYFKNK